MSFILQEFNNCTLTRHANISGWKNYRKSMSSKGNQSLEAWSRKTSEISSVSNKYTFSRQSAEHNCCTVIQLTSAYSIVTVGRNKGGWI